MLLLHSGHTLKPQFFHCFPIVSRVLYAIMVPHRSLNFTWHHFTLSPFFPPLIFHCFPILFPLFYVIFPHFFPHCFAHRFSPPLQSPQVQLGGRTRGESIPHRHPIATWYITLKKFTSVHLFYHLISRFLIRSGRSAPRPPKLTLFAKITSPSLAAGFRENTAR